MNGAGLAGKVEMPVDWRVKPLRILYQDEYLVAIDKPAGLLVHPGREPEAPEWIAMKRLRDQLGRPVHPVHRLDRPTSGVLLFALDRETAGLAQQEFELRRVVKHYWAVVAGRFPEKAECAIPLGREGEAETEAFTAFERLAVAEVEEGEAISWVKAVPETGRFHQIRRHLVALGYPIIGDYRHGGIEFAERWSRRLGCGTRMMLMSQRLEIEHPRSGQRLAIEAPEDPELTRWFRSPSAKDALR